MPTPLSPPEQTAAAKDFAAFWKGKGYEKGQTQPFWLHLLRVLGVESPESFIEFEDAAHMDSAHGFIDAYIPTTHVLIEQKSITRNLRTPIPQSQGPALTPFQQACRYSASLSYSRRPRWIVTCNFAEFHVYDMENPNAEPESILLANLPNDLYRLRFLVNVQSTRVAREMEVSIEAGRIIGDIYDALLAQYGTPTPQILHWLNVLCVRLVFCLYAEDAGIFADDQFHDYLANIPPEDIQEALLKLFEVLNQPEDQRTPYLKPALKAFPYVNGGLFTEPVEIPLFTPELKETLLRRASLGFDWADISPTIFGAVFESTLNPETRRSGGMHYTSIGNIHKVIDPLFLDDLRAELKDILAVPVQKQREARLRAYQQKLASLTFLDPACGSGNFLTETYLSLRRLENAALAALIGPQSLLDLEGNPLKVCISISQFHGIEINDFAVSVAKTALWIAESQMLAETASLLHRNLDFLPLKSYDGIVEGNALRMDWAELASCGGAAPGGAGGPPATAAGEPPAPPEAMKRNFDYIIGNPPFVGHQYRSADQTADMDAVFADIKTHGKLDFVTSWFKKAFDLQQKSPSTRTAFVATNSICQGESVATLWKPLLDRGLHIDFARRTFRWDSESSEKAHVHCVIIGFSCQSPGGAGGSPASKIAGGPPAPPGRKTYPEGWHNRHYLPHAEYRRLQFVTYRLFDSLPPDVVLRWKDELRITDATAPDSPEAAELRRRIGQYEDAGHGSCFLRDPRIAALVRDNLLHFDGDRYRLLDWCIMPNHVHVLLEVAEGQTLSGILHSWHSYTAHEANKLLGRTGPFWQTEYFDRFIRDAEHLRKTIAYIDDNPAKANLRDWPWKAPGGAGGPPATKLAGEPPAPPAPASKPLYDGDRHTLVPHINAYLLPAPDVFIQNRTAPRTPGFPKMSKGSQPTDGGNLILSPAERDSLLAETPALAPFVRPYISADDVINGKTRYCLWLKDSSPHLYRSSPELMRRLAAVAEMRSKSPTASVRRDAETPMLFTQIRQPETDYLAVPEVSSERRRYIPIAYCSCNTIASNKLYIIPDASLWLFGILISNVHMAWMRVVCGRLKSDYSYSPAVYNNFPWPGGAGGPPANSAGEPPAPPAWADRIATTARAILDARAAHPDATLADLYNPLTMPPDLLAAHRANDRAVMSAYGFDVKMAESDCVAELFKLYQNLATKTP